VAYWWLTKPLLTRMGARLRRRSRPTTSRDVMRSEGYSRRFV
jgi:hypothetical protein